MKKKILTAAVALLLALILTTPPVQAVGTVYFAGVNDKLIELSDQTMPKYYGGKLYLPYTLFENSDTGIGVFCVASSELVMLYTVEKRLKFDVARSEIFDQDNMQYYYSIKAANGTVYLPAELICSFFGLTTVVIQAELAPIIRVKNAAAVYNDPTFAGSFRDEMQTAYDAYMGITPSEGPSTAAEQTYENVTVFLNFSDIAAGQFGLLLDILDTSEYKCCIFVAADEITDNADLLRRAAGSGHTIGLRLETGSYEEYQTACEMLFEAAKVKTLFISAGSDAMQTAAATAESKGLIFWNATNTWDDASDMALSDITDRLNALSRGSESLSLTCSEKVSTVMPALLSYLTDNQFNVLRITETSAPPALPALND